LLEREVLSGKEVREIVGIESDSDKQAS